LELNKSSMKDLETNTQNKLNKSVQSFKQL
jgi:hypothetical protein